MIKKITFSKTELIYLLSIISITLLTYLNHFDNPFFFDDVHTITQNESIKSLKNWPQFFTDAKTFSSLPANRAYRPMVTLKNAIDYAVAGKLDARYFHYHIFFWYIILIILVFQLCKKLYHASFKKYKHLSITALLATTWFALHTANAETINYICARSDSFSTLCIVAALLLYINSTTKKWFLHILAMIIGIWTKQTGLMFVPILFVYIILFEEDQIFNDFKKNAISSVINTLKKIAPVTIIGVSLFIFNQFYLTPSSTDSTNYTVTRFEYITTQFFVYKHYLSNFIFPINLSADPDIEIITPWYNLKILTGLLLILGMVYLMFKTAFQKKLRPISFGIAWFFIALLPTTLNPLYQIANDHRMFFPFIGLFIACSWGISILIDKYNLINKTTIFTLLFFLACHAFGTYNRNKIWDTKESLWLDVTVKSPRNGRGLMNYGLTQMEKGNLDNALNYFNRALKLTPNYSTLHINLGIAYGAKNNKQKAVNYFKRAIAENNTYGDAEYYYSRYLKEQKKYTEALKIASLGLQKNAENTRLQNLINELNVVKNQEINRLSKLEEEANTYPTVNLLIDLSSEYYSSKNYQKVIETCQRILEIDANNKIAYNNMCSAYNQLKKWKQGVKACKKAIEIDANFQLAKNNLKWAMDNVVN
ncbi:tetratricopeptide repeat protein [Aquimarina agarivorans]|uniref:tetratricopeptide repeat protein n=1 Tax=Aquimarina agarivorans TaxID=980584 RepID=UPI000248F596|nr:tetratricopeptide repeat protein [Aquimarina agarivorans]